MWRPLKKSEYFEPRTSLIILSSLSHSARLPKAQSRILAQLRLVRHLLADAVWSEKPTERYYHSNSSPIWLPLRLRAKTQPMTRAEATAVAREARQKAGRPGSTFDSSPCLCTPDLALTCTCVCLCVRFVGEPARNGPPKTYRTSVSECESEE